MLAVQNFQTRFVALTVDQVAQQKYNAALFEQLRALAQRKVDIGSLRNRFESKHFPNQPQGVAAARFRRNVEFDPVAEHQQPHLVAVVGGAEGEDRSELGRGAPFAALRRTEHAGGGDVDQQQNRKLALFNEFFDVGRTHAGRDVPVDIPDIVLDGVLPDLLEFDTAPLEGAAVRAAGDFIDRAVRSDFEKPDLFGDFRRQHMASPLPD